MDLYKEMALRTYGDKPLSFQLEENGEFYYVGSEVIYAKMLVQMTAATYRGMEPQITFSFRRSETIYECFAVRYTRSTLE